MNIAQIYHHEAARCAILYHAIKPDIDPIKLGRDNIKTSAVECGSHIQLCRRNILCIHVFHYCTAIREYIINYSKVFVLQFQQALCKTTKIFLFSTKISH